MLKFIIAIILSLSLFSCNFDINLGSGVSGNGNVTTENRTVNQSFSKIKASEGLEVYLTQSNTESIIVETDENLQELILTEIKNGVLVVHTKDNIKYAQSKKVNISFKNITAITSTSGSRVLGDNTINTENLSIKTTSGSAIKLDIVTKNLDCKSTSGSTLKLTGKTNNLVVQATSGSSIKAPELIAKSCEVKATSGASISVNTEKKLIAKASSGASISYYGDPEEVEKSDSSSGSIKKR